MTTSDPDVRRRITGTGTLLDDPRSVAAIGRFGRERVKAAIVAAQDRARGGEIAPEDVLAVALAEPGDPASGVRQVPRVSGVLMRA